MHLLSAILFAFSANLDNFTIGTAYGMRKIRFGLLKNLIIAVITCLGTFLTLSLGMFIAGFMSIKIANLVGSMLLMLIGMYCIVSFFINQYKKSKGYHLLENQSQEPEQALHKQVMEISWQKTFALAWALMLNNLGLGLGASMTGLNPYVTTMCTFVMSLMMLWAGQWLGRSCLSKILGPHAVWVSGFVILVLGIYELLI